MSLFSTLVQQTGSSQTSTELSIPTTPATENVPECDNLRTRIINDIRALALRLFSVGRFYLQYDNDPDDFNECFPYVDDDGDIIIPASSGDCNEPHISSNPPTPCGLPHLGDHKCDVKEIEVIKEVIVKEIVTVPQSPAQYVTSLRRDYDVNTATVLRTIISASKAPLTVDSNGEVFTYVNPGQWISLGKSK